MSRLTATLIGSDEHAGADEVLALLRTDAAVEAMVMGIAHNRGYDLAARNIWPTTRTKLRKDAEGALIGLIGYLMTKEET